MTQSAKKIGNTCVGLTGYEMKLFLKKMKKLGLYSKMRESRDNMTASEAIRKKENSQSN